MVKKDNKELGDYEGAIIDIDGTVKRGDKPIDGGTEFLEELKNADINVLFFSNNPTRTRRSHAEELHEMGLVDEVSEEMVMTSASVTAEFLDENYHDSNIYVLGEKGLIDEMKEENPEASIVDEKEKIDVAVISMDRNFNYGTFSRALKAFENDPVFIATDPDGAIPSDDGLVPGSGCVVGGVTGMTGREPDYLMGKPSQYASEAALKHLGVESENCLVIGDRVNTDIKMGESNGMTTVLVKTGVTKEGSGNAEYVAESIGDIPNILREG